MRKKDERLVRLHQKINDEIANYKWLADKAVSGSDREIYLAHQAEAETIKKMVEGVLYEV